MLSSSVSGSNDNASHTSVLQAIKRCKEMSQNLNFSQKILALCSREQSSKWQYYRVESRCWGRTCHFQVVCQPKVRASEPKPVMAVESHEKLPGSLDSVLCSSRDQRRRWSWVRQAAVVGSCSVCATPSPQLVLEECHVSLLGKQECLSASRCHVIGGAGRYCLRRPNNTNVATWLIKATVLQELVSTRKVQWAWLPRALWLNQSHSAGPKDASSSSKYRWWGNRINPLDVCD